MDQDDVRDLEIIILLEGIGDQLDELGRLPRITALENDEPRFGHNLAK